MSVLSDSVPDYWSLSGPARRLDTMITIIKFSIIIIIIIIIIIVVVVVVNRTALSRYLVRVPRFVVKGKVDWYIRSFLDLSPVWATLLTILNSWHFRAQKFSSKRFL